MFFPVDHFEPSFVFLIYPFYIAWFALHILFLFSIYPSGPYYAGPPSYVSLFLTMCAELVPNVNTASVCVGGGAPSTFLSSWPGSMKAQLADRKSFAVNAPTVSPFLPTLLFL